MTIITARLSVFAILCVFAFAYPTSRTYYAPGPQSSTAPKMQLMSCRGQPTSSEGKHGSSPTKHHSRHASEIPSKPSAQYAASDGMPQAAPAAGPAQKNIPTHTPGNHIASAPATIHSPTTNAPIATMSPNSVVPGSSVELENVSASATGINSMSVGAEKDRAAAAGNAADGNMIMAAAAPGKAMGIILPSTPMF